jgi:hypothetical protein
VRVPRFWERAEGSDTGPDGRRYFRSVWGWSMTSAAEALAVARERLRSVLSDLGPGGYYPRTPLREPIVEELLDGGEQYLVVTRNRYGAEVLNTDRLLIADVDIPELERPSGGLFRRLFRRSDPPPVGEPPVVARRLERVAAWAQANPSLGVIVYRTASGLRVFVTGVPEPTTSDQGTRILAELDTDPIYRELCRLNETFRARLTPKPWRLPGMKAPRGHWPFADSGTSQRFERWLAAYQTATLGYSVCRRIASYGPPASIVESQIIGLHDDRTRVSASLPLA